jgi:hypothetical protein
MDRFTPMTRAEAVRQVYRLLRLKDAMAAIEVASLLFALGVTLDEIETAMRQYGDL